MPGLASIVMGTAPVAGGALLGVVAGNFKGPDIRAMIKQDLDLLDRIPEQQEQRRADLQRTIDGRIDDLVATFDRGRALRAMATSLHGDWRDIVLFVCAVLFTLVWWSVDHERSNWLPMFVVMVLASAVTALYALRGTWRSLSGALRR
ncbi:hypothetical protein ACAG26_13650 [Mycobacterium sp. pUA109]|uniref:hypothetical protein n=1 Tax=Mycobacterium sp. pUA109 TaxID=3238982 RepID=UPI00351B392A